jgi:hypothetical protein
MREVRTIEIDFEVHKRIEMERQSFSESPNAVLRRLLKIAPEKSSPVQQKPKSSSGSSWHRDGVELPHETKLRMYYNNNLSEGVVMNGVWIVNGKAFTTPSEAATTLGITKQGKQTNLNGWNLWEAQLPGANEWMTLAALREKSKKRINITLEDLGL